MCSLGNASVSAPNFFLRKTVAIPYCFYNAAYMYEKLIITPEEGHR